MGCHQQSQVGAKEVPLGGKYEEKGATKAKGNCGHGECRCGHWSGTPQVHVHATQLAQRGPLPQLLRGGQIGGSLLGGQLGALES